MEKKATYCKKYIFFILLTTTVLSACSGNPKNNDELQMGTIQEIDTDNMSVEDKEGTGQYAFDDTEEISPTISSDKELYRLLGLEIGDSEEKVLELYGEPDSRCYEVVGTYQLHDQSLFTYMVYEDKMIVVRKYFDETKNYEDQNGVVEIEVKGGNYESTEGVKLGDSVADVQEKYGIEHIYDYGEPDGLVSTMIYNRVEGIRDIMGREFSYEYGDFDKVAYVLSGEKFEDHCNIPAVIFLIKEGMVTRIIVMNTMDF